MIFSDHLLAALFVLFSWWISTGLILLMDGLPRSTFGLSVGGMSALALAGFYGLYWSCGVATPAAAYVAFSSALAVWAWHELMFLLGIISGPRKEVCPPGATGWRRFAYATATIIHHEVALAATVAAVVGLTWGGANQVGTLTFLVLWIMRLSAKFNVFLGVRNLNTEFIPAHLRYLLSYFKKARLNPLMPASVIVGSAVVAWLLSDAFSADATAFIQVSRTLVATILGMAVLEHLFLTLPIPDALLWRWALRSGHNPRA